MSILNYLPLIFTLAIPILTLIVLVMLFFVIPVIKKINKLYDYIFNPDKLFVKGALKKQKEKKELKFPEYKSKEEVETDGDNRTTTEQNIV